MSKSVLVILVSFVFVNSICCQTVTNMRAFEENGKVLVVYDLFSAEEKQFFIRLMSSIDNGISYKLVDNAAGDANKFVKWGSGRAISFSLEREKNTLPESYLFKVLAFPEKSITNYVNNMMKVTLISVERVEKIINFNFRIKSARSILTLIIANNFGKDLTGKNLTKWSMPEGNVKKIYPDIETNFTIQLMNEEYNDFEKIGFYVAGEIITFKGVSVGFRNEGID